MIKIHWIQTKQNSIDMVVKTKKFKTEKEAEEFKSNIQKDPNFYRFLNDEEMEIVERKLSK